MSLAVYPGSFDPITNGHLDLVARALKAFDQIIIAVAINPAKEGLFSVTERVDLLNKIFEDDERVEVDIFEGLLVNYLRKRDATAVVRGLRAVSDFEYEFQMAGMNSRLNPSVETVFLMASEHHQFISSRLVKEIGTLGGDISHFVPPLVASKLTERLGSSAARKGHRK